MDYWEGVIRSTEFFTTTELAQKLKMNVQVITRKVQAGEIGAFKVGKEWRIPEQSVFEWLQRNSNQGHAIVMTQPAPVTKPKVTVGRVTNGQHRNGSTNGNGHDHTNRPYLLEYILAQFDPNRSYTEEEVDRIIARHHPDADSVRDQFVAGRMMDFVNGRYRRRVGYTLSR